MFISLCVGCVSKTNNNEKKESVDSLTIKELFLQTVKKHIDSTAKARNYYKENLGQILPEWGHHINQNNETRLASASLRDKAQIFYSILEHEASALAWNKQLMKQGYLSDSIIKENAIRDKEQAKLQLKCFPYIRQYYAQVCKEYYWIDDIDVKITGNRSQYIHFIGARFATNKNIKTFHDNIGLTFDVLRFAQVRYSWYDGSKYTYFNIYDGKDSDPIPTILDEGYLWGVFPNTF